MLPAQLATFLGYGNLAAPLWFLGMEEGAGAEVDANVATRIALFRETMGLHEAQALLGAPIADRGRLSSVWTYMAKIARGVIDRADDWNDAAKARAYVVEHLGTPTGATFLGEVLPLPARDANCWPSPYERWFPTRAAYQDAMLEPRVAMWTAAIERHRPRVVVAYGSGHREQMRVAFGEVAWRRLETKRARIEIATLGDERTAVLAPFFGNGAFSGADAGAIVELLRA